MLPDIQLQYCHLAGLDAFLFWKTRSEREKGKYKQTASALQMTRSLN